MTMGISFSQPAVSPVLWRRSINVSIPDHVPVFRGPLCVRLGIFSISSILSLILITLSSLEPLDDPWPSLWECFPVLLSSPQGLSIFQPFQATVVFQCHISCPYFKGRFFWSLWILYFARILVSLLLLLVQPSCPRMLPLSLKDILSSQSHCPAREFIRSSRGRGRETAPHAQHFSRSIYYGWQQGEESHSGLCISV